MLHKLKSLKTSSILNAVQFVANALVIAKFLLDLFK